MSYPSLTRVSVIGLGKLGSPMVACFAARGLEVVGVETDPAKIEALNAGLAPVREPGLQELLTQAEGHYSATHDTAAAVRDTQATFIILPTPSEPGGGFSLNCVLPVCETIGQAIREKSDFHLVVLTSTVMPGSTGGAVLTALESASGKRCGEDFGLCYSPEFIAIGSVIRDFLNPDFVLIGESDPRSGAILEATYTQVCDNRPPVARMNFVNAELSKIAVNTFVTTKITFANTIAGICERLPEADVDVVTAALGHDTRIGSKYLKGAIGYGGPCFPRDNVALSTLARSVGVPALLAEATDQANREQIQRLANTVQNHLPHHGTVGILGLSYKPNTDVIEESPGVHLARILLQNGVKVIAYDPAAMQNARQALNGPIHFAHSAIDCAQQSDVLVIATPWESFSHLDPSALSRPGTPRTLIDCWRVLDAEQFAAVADYIPVGVGAPSYDIAAVCARPAEELSHAIG